MLMEDPEKRILLDRGAASTATSCCEKGFQNLVGQAASFQDGGIRYPTLAASATISGSETASSHLRNVIDMGYFHASPLLAFRPPTMGKITAITPSAMARKIPMTTKERTKQIAP